MSRTRSDSTDHAATTWIQTSTNGTSWTNYVQPAFRAKECQARYTIDEVTPHFHVRRANGEIIMNPLESWSSTLNRFGIYGYSAYDRTDSNGSVSSFHARALDPNIYNSNFRFPRIPIADRDVNGKASELAAFGLTAGSLNSLEQTLLAQALEQATSSDALALVTMAELDKTVDLFASGVRAAGSMVELLDGHSSKWRRSFNEVLKTLGQLRSRKQATRQFLKTLDRSMRSAASSWLGYRYGVMATIYDIQSWVDASRSGNRRARYTANRTTTQKFDPVVTTTATWQQHALQGPFVSTVQRFRRTRSTAGVLMGTEIPGTGMDRYGVNRLASTAWELIPFSFVLDWLVDSGTRLAAFEGSLLVKPLGTWVSHRHDLFFTQTYAWHISSGSTGGHTYWATGADEGLVTEHIVYKTRVPNPKLVVLPQLDVSLNWKRMADSAALLAGFTRKFRGKM